MFARDSQSARVSLFRLIIAFAAGECRLCASAVARDKCNDESSSRLAFVRPIRQTSANPDPDPAVLMNYF